MLNPSFPKPYPAKASGFFVSSYQDLGMIVHDPGRLNYMHCHSIAEAQDPSLEIEEGQLQPAGSRAKELSSAPARSMALISSGAEPK